MLEPGSMSPGSVMPAYPWMLDATIDTASTPAKIRTMQKLGVPYPEGYDQVANADLMKQAEQIKGRLAADKIKTPANREIIAMIAYLQRMGTDIKALPSTASVQ
jgi:cytochrome c oxidase cbb3-type subunit I/II